MNELACERLAKSISLNATDKAYNLGDRIITAGEHGTEMFIIHQGSAAAFIAGSSGEETPEEYSQQVKAYDVKDVFGEIALLHSLKKDEFGNASATVRMATVKATSDGTRVWKLGPSDLAIAGREVVTQVALMAQAYESVKADEQEAEAHFHEAPLHMFEHQCKLVVDFGMLFFAW
jgi:hypothetical protein